jgi:hypothetical protein
MNGIGIGIGVLALVIALLVAYRMRPPKPEVAGYGTQRMCPACGLITPRSKSACLECGRVFVSASVRRR